jgi:hypothetical protein
MRLIRHRLSPRDTTLVKFLGATAGEETPSSGFKATLSEIAVRKGGCVGGRVRDALSRTYSAPDCAAPELAPKSFTVTFTPCFDDATVPSGNLAFNVSS